MPKRPDLPCAGCGRLMWRGPGTLPPGEARCRECRKAAPPRAAKRTSTKRKSPASSGATALAPEPAPEPDPTPPPRAGSIAEAAASGDHLQTLRAMRDRLARSVDACASPRELAPLNRQLLDVLRQIYEAEGKGSSPAPAQKGTPLDELNRRRAARQAGTAGRART